MLQNFPGWNGRVRENLEEIPVEFDFSRLTECLSNCIMKLKLGHRCMSQGVTGTPAEIVHKIHHLPKIDISVLRGHV